MSASFVRARRLAGWLPLVGLMAVSNVGYGADHQDTEALAVEAGFDIADVFVWLGMGQPPPPPVQEVDDAGEVDTGIVDAGVIPDEPFLFMAMTLSGKPAPGAQYIFHLDSRQDLTTGGDSGYAVCIFAQDLTLQCWVRDQLYVEGDATFGVENDGLMVWAGFGNDPTFGNTNAVRTLVADLTLAQTASTSACPVLGSAERAGLLEDLQARPSDTFAGQRTFAIVLRMKPEIAAPGGPLLGVSASVRIAQ